MTIPDIDNLIWVFVSVFLSLVFAGHLFVHISTLRHEKKRERQIKNILESDKK